MRRQSLWMAAAMVVIGMLWGARTGAAQSSDMQMFYAQQMQGLQAAMNDPTANARAQGIWYKLVRYTGRMIPVLPAQTFRMGQALPNGVVLLDVSLLGQPEEVTAFWMAHEYGHQILGHPQMSLTALGQYRAMWSGTSDEDAADRWSGRFLQAAGYDVEPALAFLCALPDGGPGDAHSKGPARAAMVARSYGHSGAVCGGGGGVSREDEEDDPGAEAGGGSLAEGLRRIMAAAPRFRAIRGSFDSQEEGARVYLITVTLEGFEECVLYDESGSPDWVGCDANDDEWEYDSLAEEVEEVLGPPDEDRGEDARWRRGSVEVRVYVSRSGALRLWVSAEEE